jgi:signal peptidase II
MKRSYKLAGILTLAVVILDQASKAWILANIVLYTTHPVIPGFFNIVHVLNKGAAFGFLNRADITWQTYLFFATTAMAVVLILHLLRAALEEDTGLICGLGLILGGALGNLVDRIRFGEVVDFLDFHYGDMHWPAFNVADIAITLGSVALLASFLRARKAPPEEQ